MSAYLDGAFNGVSLLLLIAMGLLILWVSTIPSEVPADREKETDE